MKLKYFLVIILFAITLIPVSADSDSLNLEISSVTMGPNGFGMGLAPVGTEFKYYKYFRLNQKFDFDAVFKTNIAFSFPDNVSFSGYDYESGEPIWKYKYLEVKDNYNYIHGYYFNPQASANIYLSQGFGLNPINKRTELITLEFNFNTRYSRALEAISAYEGTWLPAFIEIDSSTGQLNYKEPFAPGNNITAYPWLQDSRITWSNYIKTGITLDLSKSTGFAIRDGLILDAYFEYGPKWLMNNLSMNDPTSDYYKLNFSATEYLSLYSKKQDNGYNWLSIMLVHSNYMAYTSGSVIPYNKLPHDRLNSIFEDDLYIQIMGPQFIANDCYTDIRIGLYNYCYFGSVVNESPSVTKAFEWQSDFTISFHMKLFGFMHFKYRAWYDIMTGIHTYFPEWGQQAKIAFYISL